MRINLFETAPTDDELVQQQQKIHTRVYVILFISVMSVLLFYDALVERKITKTQQSPSFVDYNHLYDLYRDGINCPCAHVAIPYSGFVTELRVDSFHQVCVGNGYEPLLLDGNYSGSLHSSETGIGLILLTQ